MSGILFTQEISSFSFLKDLFEREREREQGKQGDEEEQRNKERKRISSIFHTERGAQAS